MDTMESLVITFLQWIDGPIWLKQPMLSTILIIIINIIIIQDVIQDVYIANSFPSVLQNTRRQKSYNTIQDKRALFIRVYNPKRRSKWYKI